MVTIGGMNLSDLVFTGFNRRVAALSKHTGDIIWQWKATDGGGYGGAFVSLLLDGDLLIVAVNGYMYGLDARTGSQRWYNEMAGFGVGVTSLASTAGSMQNLQAAVAAQAAAAAASST